MANLYKGLDVPRGLNIDNLDELDLESAKCAAANMMMDGCSNFCAGIFCHTCICDTTHRSALREFVDKEKKGVKPGMVVRFATKRWCLVWSVDAEGVHGLRIYAEPEKLPKFGSVANIPYANIEKGYKLKSAGEYEIPSGQHINELLLGDGKYWEESYSPVLELTMDDIEKKYGRKVKIIGEKND